LLPNAKVHSLAWGARSHILEQPDIQAAKASTHGRLSRLLPRPLDVEISRQAVSDRRQQRIACISSLAVIDRMKIIQIEIRKRNDTTEAMAPRHRLTQAIGEQSPIG
jgi:hypothetical protein